MNLVASPEDFVAKNPLPNALSFTPYRGKVIEFLQSTAEGQQFISDMLNGNTQSIPVKRSDYIANNTIEKYTTWYASYIAAQEAEKKKQALAAAASEFGIMMDGEEDYEEEEARGTSSTGLTPLKRHIRKQQEKIEELKVLAQKAEEVSPLKKTLAKDRQTSVQLSKELKEVKEKLETTEQRLQEEIQRIKSQMGGDALAGILADKPSSSSTTGSVLSSLSDISALDLELASYYRKIEDINKQIERYGEVRTDYEHVKALYDESLESVVVTREVRQEKRGKRTLEVELVKKSISDVTKILELMAKASQIANKYKPIKFEGEEREIRDGLTVTIKRVDGVKEKMEKSSAEKRVTMLVDIFENTYIEIPSNEMLRLEKIDHLQKSLNLTLNFEASILTLKNEDLYPSAEFTKIDGIISKALSDLRAKIIEQDRRTYEEYSAILEEESSLLNQTALENFSNLPMTLQLLRAPMAFFMLEKPSENVRVIPFNSLARVGDEIQFLTEKQKKALFSYLYSIIFNFEDISRQYLKANLRTRTPIKPEDLHGLIKLLKEALRTSPEQKAFEPTSITQGELGKFSLKIDDLISGKTYRNAVIGKFLGARASLNQLLAGIPKEALETYQSYANAPEEHRSTIGNILNCWETLSQQGTPVIKTESETAELEHLIFLENELAKAQQDLAKDQDLLIKLSKTLLQGDTSASNSLAVGITTTGVASPSSLNAMPSPGKKKNTGPLSKVVSAMVSDTSFVDTIMVGKVLLTEEVSKGKFTAAAEIKTDDNSDVGNISGRAAPSLMPINEQDLELSLHNIETHLETQRATINEEEYQNYKSRIEAAKANIAAEALPMAKIKIKKLQKDLNIEVKIASAPVFAAPIFDTNPRNTAVVIPQRRSAIDLAATTAESLEQDLVQLESQLETKKDGMTEEEYEGYKNRIQTARNNIETALPTAQMKIKSLKRDLK